MLRCKPLDLNRVLWVGSQESGNRPSGTHTWNGFGAPDRLLKIGCLLIVRLSHMEVNAHGQQMIWSKSQFNRAQAQKAVDQQCCRGHQYKRQCELSNYQQITRTSRGGRHPLPAADPSLAGLKSGPYARK